MKTTLNLKSIDETLYVPRPARIVTIKQFTDKEKFFRLELQDGKSLGHIPGQFVQVSVLGIGEAPISISSPSSQDPFFDLCLRAVGDVTHKLHTLHEGDVIHIRGPFGHGFDDQILSRLQNKHLVFIAGGIGYVPLRSLINTVIPTRSNYKKLSILYGCRTPADRMYQDELKTIAAIGENVELLETVDRGDESWKGNVGVITTLVPKVKCNPDEAIAIIVGPPIMYKFVLMSLMKANFKKENIYMSLERRMKCGIGKCGHCQMEGVYVCQEGPVFNYAEVENNQEVF